MKVRNVLIVAALIQANLLMLLALVAAVLVTGGLISLGSALSGEETGPVPGADSEPTAEPEVLRFGEPYTFKTDQGSVRMSVGKPVAVTFHKAEFDEDCTVDPDTCTRPGAKLGPWLRVPVSLEGLSGRVETSGMFEYTYEAPGGDVLGAMEPSETFEQLHPLSGQVSALSKGQKVRGDLYFQADSADGKVIVTPVGDDPFAAPTPVVWAAK